MICVVKEFRQLLETKGERLQNPFDEWRGKCDIISDENYGRMHSAVGKF